MAQGEGALTRALTVLVLGIAAWVSWDAVRTVEVYEERISTLERRIKQNETHPGFWDDGRWFHCYKTHITERRK